MRHSVLWEKLAEQAFRELDILRRKFYEFNCLHLLKPAAATAAKSLGFSRQEHWSGVPFPSPMCESEK